MANKGFSYSLSFLYLVITLCPRSNGQNPMSHHMENMDGAAKVGFFTMDDLYVGKTLKIQFFSKDPSSLPPLLRKEEADLIPFSLSQYPQLLQFFSIQHGTYEAKMIEQTLKHCEVEPIKGERKLCPASLESMVEFVTSVLGHGIDFRALQTTHLGKRLTSVFQNYTFLHVKEETSPKMVACHIMAYPYRLYYCHSQSTNKVFQILARGEDGDMVNGLTVCHVDTSHWSPDHVSFSILHVMPGTVPICHFFNPNNLVWVPNDK